MRTKGRRRPIYQMFIVWWYPRPDSVIEIKAQ
jgi:hypothetical protein